MATPPPHDDLAPRALLAQIASTIDAAGLLDETSAVVVTSHGEPAIPPEWIGDLFPSSVPGNGALASSAFDLVAEESQHDILVAFAAARRLPHVVSAIRLAAKPEQLCRIHLVSIEANDPDGIGVPCTVTVSVPDDDATPYEDPTDHASLISRRIEYRCNEIGVLLSYDPAFGEILGWEPADLLGKQIIDIIHPDDADDTIDRWLTVLTSSRPVRSKIRQRTKSGEWRWFEVTNTNLLESEGFVLCELLDVTSEMTMLVELTEQEELLRRLTDALPTAVVHFDRHGKLLFANDRLAEITGVVHGVLEDYIELFDPGTQDDIRDMAHSIYSDAIEVDMEATLYRADGQVRHTRLAFRPLAVDQSGAGGLLVCVDDITESWTLRTELAKQAATDGLTGVANRASIHRSLADATADRRSSGTGVVYFDLNGFKDANDNLGHAHGDVMLVTLANRLLVSARDTDYIGRVGGDEFIVVAPDIDQQQLAALAKRLLDSVVAPSDRFAIDAACGFTFVAPPPMLDDDDDDQLSKVQDDRERVDVDRAICEADAAMYVHKRNPGPWPVQFHSAYLSGLHPTASMISNKREAS